MDKVGGLPFPLVLPWGARPEEAAARLPAHGAIVFRGTPLRTAEDFDRFVASFGWENFAYEESLSNAVRVGRTSRVVTANEAPADVTIRLHHEMAQTPVHPRKLFFFCEKPADEGGATALCRSDALVDELRARRPRFVRDCEEKGLLYTLTMPAESDPASGMGRSWRSTFRAATREGAEERMRRLGYSWEWLADGSLRATTPVLPAVRDLGNGRKSFFNQLIAAYQGWKDARNDPSRAVRHGDGSPVDGEGVDEAARLADRLAVDVAWERGDVALVDNYVALHGRRPFKGARSILVSLVA
jgi:alpha-ketoglutarate-dependent taurine dioxygenase